MAINPVTGLASPLFQVVGFGVGSAVGPLLRPPIQDLINFAWTEHPVRPLSADVAAQMWVEGVWTEARAKTEAGYTGVGGGRMDALHDLIDNPPDVATLFMLWRRGLIDAAKFNEGLRHLRLETDYFGPLRGLQQILLTPGELAQARQRGFIDQTRQYAEAELQGVDNERAEVQFKSAGLPPPTERALSMWRRGIIGEAEFKQTIVEGNEKLKYQDEEAALFRALLSPAQIVNQRLRGWRDTAWMNERLADHGYNAEDALDLFEGQGRPITYRQVFIGQRRGGVYNGSTAGIEPAFLKALQESNIRPEWYALAWAIRHSLPSVFVMRALTQDGTWSRDKAEQRLLMSGWIPEDAAEAADKWSGMAAGTAMVDPLVKSARTQAVTEIRSAYLLGQSDDATARGWLGRVGVTAEAQDGLLPIWDVMREVPQKGLTAAQIVKAFHNLPLVWPRARAVDALVTLGLTTTDANTLLDE